MNDEPFTAAELIAELLAARPTPEDDPTAMTVRELMVATGKSQSQLTRYLRELHEAGRLETTRKSWTRIDGTRTTVPAYRMKA